jgi:mRNA interferase RelE/StbE
MYKVIWEKRAQKDLKKIDFILVKKIVEKVETYLAQDPVNIGESLRHDYKGLFRFRFEDYRVIYQIKHQQILIIVIEVGHRREIYRKR